jgi:hypothetical protein
MWTFGSKIWEVGLMPHNVGEYKSEVGKKFEAY